MTDVNLGLTTSSVNVNLVGGAPVQVVFEQGEPKQVVLSLANTVLSTGPGGGGAGYPSLNMPTGFSVSGSGSAIIVVTYSAGYSLPTTAKQSEWDSAFADRLKWDGGSTGLNASTGRASLQLGGAATLDVGTAAGTVAAGNDVRFHSAVTLAASVADVLNLVGQELGADDPGGDRLLFWDDSEGKLTHASIGPGIVLDGTTLRAEEWLWVACSDETTALTAGAAKITFRLPYAATLLAVRASVTTAPAGADLVVDVNEGGVSLLSTKLSIDAGETTSTTAATPAVISDSALADDAEITIDIDQIGSSPAGAGLKVGLYLRRV